MDKADMIKKTADLINDKKLEGISDIRDESDRKGMRIVWNDEEFESAWNMARNEARASFSNDGIYVEKFIEEPRHIEFQIAGDQKGKVVHLSERDCSIQRRHQKIIEEAPAPDIDPDVRKKLNQDLQNPESLENTQDDEESIKDMLEQIQEQLER